MNVNKFNIGLLGIVISLSSCIALLSSFSFLEVKKNNVRVENDTIQISYTKVNATSYNQPDGSISVIITGGTPPYLTKMNRISSDTTLQIYQGSTFDLNGLEAGGYLFVTYDAQQNYTFEAIIIEDHK